MTIAKGETKKSEQLPTYHWSQILSPRYKDLNQALLFEPVTITQSVHLNNQAPKNTKAHPALVVYDSSFVQYKLLEVIAPFLSSRLDSAVILGLTDDNDIVDDDFLNNLGILLVSAGRDAIKLFKKSSKDCEEIGVTLDNSPSTILRTIKLSTAREYKFSRTTAFTI